MSVYQYMCIVLSRINIKRNALCRFINICALYLVGLTLCVHCIKSVHKLNKFSCLHEL